MNSFERVVKNAVPILRAKQVATFWKIPNDIRLTSGEVIYGDRGPCDFIGHTAYGAALLIEAKQRAQPSLGVGNQSKDIKGHQWIALRDAEMCGALALILWQRGEQFVVLSWSEANKLRGDRRSIPWPTVLARQLEGEEASVEVARTLIERVDLHRKSSHAFRQVVDRAAE